MGGWAYLVAGIVLGAVVGAGAMGWLLAKLTTDAVLRGLKW